MTAQAGDTFSIKRALRRELRLRRAALSAPLRRQAARLAAHKALHWLRQHRCRTVAVYISQGSELDTAPLLQRLWLEGYRVCVPRTRDGAQMDFVPMEPATRLRQRRHGLLEPVPSRQRLRRRDIDAVLLPLVGYDADGRRLGAGGGYYDRWLAQPRCMRRPLRAGYAYALQAVERLPEDPWDVRLDAVITERGITTWPTG